MSFKGKKLITTIQPYTISLLNTKIVNLHQYLRKELGKKEQEKKKLRGN